MKPTRLPLLLAVVLSVYLTRPAPASDWPMWRFDAHRSAASPKNPPAAYTVRLHFAEPDGLTPGERVFGLSFQGEPVLENFDLAKAAGGRQQGVVKEFHGVIIQDDLQITFRRAPGSSAGPILCGIELVAEP